MPSGFLPAEFQGTSLNTFETVMKEPETIRDEYGSTPFAQGCLMARRLVESGVRFVVVHYGPGQPQAARVMQQMSNGDRGAVVRHLRYEVTHVRSERELPAQRQQADRRGRDLLRHRCRVERSAA